MVGLPQHIAAIFVWPLHPSDLYHVGLVIHLFSPWIFVGDQFWALLPAPMVKLSVRLKFHFFLAPWTAKITLPRTSNSRVGGSDQWSMQSGSPSLAWFCHTENAICSTGLLGTTEEIGRSAR